MRRTAWRALALLSLALVSTPAFADPPRNEPLVLEPVVALGTAPRRAVRLTFGYAGVKARGTSAASLAFTAGYTFAPEDGDFSLDMKLPFGSVGQMLLGDIAFDFRWRALSTDGGTRVALGFGFLLPSVLINSLGGNNDEIWLRRSEDTLYDELNLLPIRYWDMSPAFALSQRIGPVLVTADAGLAFILASKTRNRYEAPRAEFAVRYDLAVSGMIVRDVFAGVLEMNGLSYATDISGDDKDGALRPKGTGLTLTFGARVAPDPRVVLSAGLQVPLVGSDKIGTYDLTHLYVHELSAFVEARFLILPTSERRRDRARPGPRAHGGVSTGSRDE